MFGTIRKHQSWLWWIVIIVIVISFVVFFSPTASNPSAQRGPSDYGTVDGVRITDRDFINAYHEANLEFLMKYGTWPDADAKRMGFDPDRETYYRLFLIQKLKEHNISVDTASVARTANSVLTGLSRGQGGPVPFETFVSQVLAPQGMTAADFERFIRHELGVQQLISVLGVAGKLVTPAEAELLYRRERQEMTGQAVFFVASNYVSNVSAPTAEAIGQFYTNRMENYRIPDRIQVGYVKFNVTNFLADADEQISKMTNAAALLDSVYQRRGTNYYKGELNPEQAKEKIREEMRRELAMTTGRKKANDFASEVFDAQPPQPENLYRLAQSNGLTAAVSEPFDAETGPTEFDGGPNFTKAAFALNATEPFAGPLVGSDGAYVITLHKRIPSEIPPLQQIRKQVETDLQYDEALMLARRTGFQFADTLTNGLAQGKTFAGISTGAKLHPTPIPPFSLSIRELPEVEDHITLNQFKKLALDTEPGKASGFVSTRDGGLVVYMEQKLPLDEAKMRAEMPAFLNAVRQARQNDAINHWYRRESEKSLRDSQLMRNRNAMNSLPANR